MQQYKNAEYQRRNESTTDTTYDEHITEEYNHTEDTNERSNTLHIWTKQTDGTS